MADVAELVLHHLVIKGFATPGALGMATGVDVDGVEAALRAFERDGWVAYLDGRLQGWRPTPLGREVHRGLVVGSLAPVDASVRAWYDRFSELNAELKQLCTDWQLRATAGKPPVPNDHTDPAYDAGVIDRLRALHRQADAECTAVERSFPRAARYRARLSAALAAVEAGDRDRFTKPMHESYHDVWMELHQDLLISLGRERTAADA